MKNKFKNTKGITLVALIITIIVLLILAVVAITSINNSNIIKHAHNGKEAYEQGKTNEATTLAEYEQYLDDNLENSIEYPFIGKIYVHPMNDEQGNFNAITIEKNNSNYIFVFIDGDYDLQADEYTVNSVDDYGMVKVIKKDNTDFISYFENNLKNVNIDINNVQEYVLEVNNEDYIIFDGSYDKAYMNGYISATDNANLIEIIKEAVNAQLNG